MRQCWKWTGWTNDLGKNVSITSRIKELEERISARGYTIKDQRKSLVQEIPNTKFSENMGHRVKTKIKNNRNRRRWRNTAQMYRKHIQHKHRRKLLQHTEGYGYECTRILEDAKQTETKMICGYIIIKIPNLQNN